MCLCDALASPAVVNQWLASAQPACCKRVQWISQLQFCIKLVYFLLDIFDSYFDVCKPNAALCCNVVKAYTISSAGAKALGSVLCGAL